MSREKGMGNPFRVGVIGAGPAGTFFAIHLHNLGNKYGKKYKITLFDRKVFDMVGPGGCNMCAGAIGYITYEKIKETGIELQEAVVRRIAEGYVFHGKMSNAQIIHPQRRGIYTVFRGGGPIIEDEHCYKSFDQFLLDCCIDRGMSFINERVKNVQDRADGPEKSFIVSTPGGGGI